MAQGTRNEDSLESPGFGNGFDVVLVDLRSMGGAKSLQQVQQAIEVECLVPCVLPQVLDGQARVSVRLQIPTTAPVHVAGLTTLLFTMVTVVTHLGRRRSKYECREILRVEVDAIQIRPAHTVGRERSR